MNRDERVTAQFAPLAVPGEHTVTVKRVGLGPGSITSDIDGIDCPEDCTESYADGTRLELTASTESGTFEGWGVDACDDEELTCEIELIQDIQLAPRFMAKPGQGPDRTLKVTLDGTGSGSVTSEDGGIDCPNDCKATFADGTRVQLTASQGNDSTFEGWGNDACDDEERTCEVELTEDVELRPVFADSEPSNPRLTVTVSLPGVSDETAQIYPDVSTTVTASVTIGTSAGQPCTVSATNAERLKGTQSTRCPYDVSEGTAVAVAPAFRSYVISWPSCPAGKPSGSSSSCAFTMPARDEAVSVLLDRGPG